MIRLRAPQTLDELAARRGGSVRGDLRVERVARAGDAGAGDLCPLLSKRFVDDAKGALGRGAAVLASKELARFVEGAVWSHENATWALAELLDDCIANQPRAVWGEGTTFGDHVVLTSRVILGARVRIDANTVIGRPGFGWAFKDGEARAIPQLGGVVIEDDVHIGPRAASTRARSGPRASAAARSSTRKFTSGTTPTLVRVASSRLRSASRAR